jgi:hypothetical protein
VTGEGMKTDGRSAPSNPLFRTRVASFYPLTKGPKMEAHIVCVTSGDLEMSMIELAHSTARTQARTASP